MESVNDVLSEWTANFADNADPELLSNLIIEEVERSLPNVIANLDIPAPLDKKTTKLLQSKLLVKKGFRRAKALEQKRAREQLTESNFIRSLKLVKDQLSSNAHAGTHVHSVSDVMSESSVDSSFKSLIRKISGAVSETPTNSVYANQEGDLLAAITAYGIQHEKATSKLTASILQQTAFPVSEWEEPILDVPNVPIELQEPLTGRDIRKLVVLFRGGKIVGFLEPDAIKLLPKGIDRLFVPDNNVYKSLNLEQLMTHYHKRVTSTVAGKLNYSDELRLVDSLLASLENEAQWSRINQRRFHLIVKEQSLGLERIEIEELEKLQDLAAKEMHAVGRLPFSELAMIETYARGLGYDLRANQRYE